MTTGPIVLRGDWQHTDGKGHVRLVDSYDAVENVHKIAMLSWDTGTLAWVKFTGVAGGGGGAGGPATIADGADVTQGAKADAAWDGAAASPTIVAILKYVGAKLEAARALLAGTLTVNTGLAQGLTDVQLRAVAVPVSAANLDAALSTRATEATLALIKAKTDNLDVLLSTRTKAADVQQTRALTAADVVTAVASDANFGATVTPKAASVWDISDRVGRALGVIASITAAVDFSDRAARLVGRIYGSQGQQLLQTAVNFNSQVEIAVGAALVDPRAIRALTNADVVKAQLQDNAGTAVTVGQKAAASSLPVVLASDASGGTQASALYIRPRKLVTYRALYRLAARPYALSSAFAAAGRKQFATIHHAAAATKLVKLRHVWVAVESSSVAALDVFDLVRITTAPATGNPAITPAVTDGAAAAAEATCLALPTTAGTEAGIVAFVEWNLGVTAAGTVVNPPPPVQWVDLVSLVPGFDPDDEGTLPQIRAGVLEGWAATLDCSAIATEKAYVIIEFTEE